VRKAVAVLPLHTEDASQGEGFAGWSPLVTCVMRVAAFIPRSVEGLGGVSGLANAAKPRFRFQHKQEGASGHYNLCLDMYP